MLLLDMLLLLSRYFYFHSFRSLMQKNTMDFFFFVCKLSAFNANSSHKIEAKRRRRKKQNSHVSQRGWLAAVCTVCAHSFCTLLRLTYAKELWFDYYDVQITITNFFPAFLRSHLNVPIDENCIDAMSTSMATAIEQQI